MATETISAPDCLSVAVPSVGRAKPSCRKGPKGSHLGGATRTRFLIYTVRGGEERATGLCYSKRQAKRALAKAPAGSFATRYVFNLRHLTRLSSGAIGKAVPHA